MTIPITTLAIPVYNGERYIGALLDSVRVQDDDRLEIVITDNASTDATMDVVSTAAARDDRIRVFRATENAGAARNFNWAFDEARGEYFKWVAADDLIAPTFVSECRAALESDPGVVLAYPRAIDIGPDGETLQHWGDMQVAHGSSPSDRFGEILTDPKRGFPVFGLMRREQLARTSLIGSYTGSDLGLLAELAVIGRFHEVPGELFLHREHEERSTRAYTDMKERTLWFDTSKTAKWSHPYWAMYRGYAKALTRARMSPAEYAKCVRHLAIWGKQWHRYLGSELKTSAQQVVRRKDS